MALLDEALHASAPEGYKCSDCTIDHEPCVDCYTVWWTKRHPNVHRIGEFVFRLDKDWQALPPSGERVMCMRDGEWMGAIGVWNGSDWEGKTKPIWYKDMTVLQPMGGPTHWKSIKDKPPWDVGIDPGEQGI